MEEIRHICPNCNSDYQINSLERKKNDAVTKNIYIKTPKIVTRAYNIADDQQL